MRALVLTGLAVLVAGGALYLLVRAQDEKAPVAPPRDAGVVERSKKPELVGDAAVDVPATPWTIRGRVVERGKAQHAITVSMQEYLGSDTTDETGAFELRGTRTGSVTVIAEDRASGRRGTRSVDIAAGADLDGVEIELEPTGRLDIRVVDLDGKPVQGAEVAVWGPAAVASYFPTSAAATDRDGAITRFGLTKGRVSVVVVIATEKIVQTAELSTPASQQSMQFVISRQGGFKIAGTVRDERGTPLAGAHVRIGSSVTIDTDKAGRFTFEHLLDGKYQLTAWTGPASSTTALDASTLEVESDTTDAALVVYRLGTLIGFVRGFSEPPVIEILPIDPPTNRPHMTNATAKGITPIQLRYGRYRILAFNPTEVGATEVMIRPGEKTQISLEASRPATLYGLATRFPDRAAAAGYQCAAGPRQATTDARGAFTLGPLAPGPIDIVCEDGTTGVGSMRVVAKAGGNDVRIEVVEAKNHLVDRLGAELQPRGDQLVFANVKRGGAAATAGVSDGDVLVSVAGISATGPSATASATYLKTRAAGQTTAIRVRPKTGSAIIDLSVTAK